MEVNTWFQEIHMTLLKVTQLVRGWRVDTTIQLPHSYRILIELLSMSMN